MPSTLLTPEPFDPLASVAENFGHRCADARDWLREASAFYVMGKFEEARLSLNKAVSMAAVLVMVCEREATKKG